MDRDCGARVTAASNDLRARFGSLRSEDVAALDRAAQEIGISTLQLMEIAGWQVARCAWHMVNERPATIAVVAGRGNNGGDGLVAARSEEHTSELQSRVDLVCRLL